MAQKKNIEGNESGRSLVMESAIRFAKGGLSGLVSGGLLQPLQVIKTSMQVKPIEA